jgi:hypothetical protein
MAVIVNLRGYFRVVEILTVMIIECVFDLLIRNSKHARNQETVCLHLKMDTSAERAIVGCVSESVLLLLVWKACLEQ